MGSTSPCPLALTPRPPAGLSNTAQKGFYVKVAMQIEDPETTKAPFPLCHCGLVTTTCELDPVLPPLCWLAANGGLRADLSTGGPGGDRYRRSEETVHRAPETLTNSTREQLLPGCYFSHVFVVLEKEPRTLYILIQCSIAEPDPQASH